MRAASAFLDWSPKVTVIVYRALPRTFWRVRIEDADEVDAALGLFSGAYPGCGRAARGISRQTTPGLPLRVEAEATRKGFAFRKAVQAHSYAAPDHRSRLARSPLPCGGAVQHDRREPAA